MKITEALAFNNFYKTISNKPMSISFAYQLNALNDSLQKDVEFYSNNLKDLLNQYAEKDENGEYKLSEDKESVILIPETLKEFEEKYNELQNLEVEFNENLKLDLSTLEDLNITPAQLGSIKNFIK